MSLDGENSRWICGRVGSVNLQRVSSIVRDIGEPCLHHIPAKVSRRHSKGNKMLKPEKWQAIFDCDGRVLGFKKALKLIVLGGVDPSIRAEVWEFLLGCYALSTTAEYRTELRMARRDRYMDLIRQCQKMHSSVGTGSLAYVVGSKVMDVRTMSKEKYSGIIEVENGQPSNGPSEERGSCSNQNNVSTDAFQRENSTDFGDPMSVRASTDSAAYDFYSSKPGGFFDFPPLPVTNLFRKSSQNELWGESGHDRRSVEKNFRLEERAMHSFQINNNVDLIMEANGSSTNNEKHISNVKERSMGSTNVECETELMTTSRISDIQDVSLVRPSTSRPPVDNGDKVSEWLWTLHRIVVDVVRTDSHLEFYNDSKNVARMSDILAVYAWVDPATGYCQGMSDLLSPFVVLYEDNADAFWCFEMLLRRLRENFQMEGPTRVMNQLDSLGKILELTDPEISLHLSVIGAESFHFAFRMLLVLFRRELTFSEALRMWEMMWAADFREAAAEELEATCLEPLVLQLPRKSAVAGKTRECGRKSMKYAENEAGDVKNSQLDNDGVRSVASYPFCGLASASFWPRNQVPLFTISSSSKNGSDELAVFCVAAVLVINRQRIFRAAHSLDDLIKMFNDKMLKFNVKRCIRLAIKLRKRYFDKLIRQPDTGSPEK